MFFFFFFSELFPLFLVVAGIYMQIDWKKIKETTKKSININNSTYGHSYAAATIQTTQNES